MNRISFLLLLFLVVSVSFAASAQSEVTIRATGAKDIISKHIYGHFAEHLGRCIYDGFYVGEKNQAVPNTNGVRNDVIEALRKLKIPNLRWPGGCFADTYHWKDGIGPKDKRPAMVNKWWGGVTEDNSFGTHDFLNMCELLDAEPYLSGNVGSGTVQELADWVQYVNSDTKNPMADLRRQNGREKPWKVSFWGIGNEAWGCGGNMRPEYYANIYRQYSTFMSDNGDKEFMKIASGAGSDDYNWTETLMKGIPPGMIDGLALHHYSVIDWSKKSSATGFTESEYFQTMSKALFMDSLIIRHTAIMDKYDPAKKIALVVDEWGGWYEVEPGTNPGFLYQQNTMRDAMIAGVTLNIFNNHCDRVKMANLAQTVNVLQAVILTDREKMILTPTYHVMEMYNVHQDATLLPLTVRSPAYGLDGKKLPAVSASASRDKKGAVHLSLVNIDPKTPQRVTVKMEGVTWGKITGRVLSSPKLQDFNSFTNPDQIKPVVFKDFEAGKDGLVIMLPPASVVVLSSDQK